MWREFTQTAQLFWELWIWDDLSNTMVPQALSNEVTIGSPPVHIYIVNWNADLPSKQTSWWLKLPEHRTYPKNA